MQKETKVKEHGNISLSESFRPLRTVPNLLDRHPYIVILILPIVLWTISRELLLLIKFPLSILHLPSFSWLVTNLLGELLLALELAALISWSGWWSVTGFTQWIRRKGVAICIVPLLLIALPLLPFLMTGYLRVPFSILLMAVITSLLIGFVEEGCFRGVILGILLPGGILRAVLFSSLFFACFHIDNLLHGFPWPYVAEQIILGIGMGSLFATVRLRTGSIWPLILLHAIRDIPGLIMFSVNPHRAVFVTPEGIVITSILSLLFVLYAVYLLRPSQLAKLRVAYGLVPIPTPTQPHERPPILMNIDHRSGE